MLVVAVVSAAIVGLLVPVYAAPPRDGLCSGLTGDALTRCLYSELDDRLRSLGSTPTASATPTQTPTPTPRPTPTTSPTVAPVAGNLGMMVFLNPAEPAAFDRDLAALVETGSRWIRMGIPEGQAGSVTGDRWTPNTANMNYFESTVDKADQAGLRIVLVLANALNNNAWTDEQHRTYLGQYVEHVSSRVGSQVDLWQVYNEHDGRDFRSYAPVTLTSAYMERLRLALVQARTSLRRYSTAPLTTTAFGYPVNQARYDKWRTFFDGIGSALDVIAIHAYPERSATVIGLVPTYVRQLKQRYGKPVAVLEFGLPNVSGYGTPTQVGQAVVDQIRAVMSAEPFCAALYQLRDRGTNTNDGEQMFGVLNTDWSRKSYYDAVVVEVKRWRA